jgi:hypothetical protein
MVIYVYYIGDGGFPKRGRGGEWGNESPAKTAAHNTNRIRV